MVVQPLLQTLVLCLTLSLALVSLLAQLSTMQCPLSVFGEYPWTIACPLFHCAWRWWLSPHVWLCLTFVTVTSVVVLHQLEAACALLMFPPIECGVFEIKGFHARISQDAVTMHGMCASFGSPW